MAWTPHQGIQWAPLDYNCKVNLLTQIVWSLNSQTLSLTPKIGHRKKRKLDSNPRYGPVINIYIYILVEYEYSVLNIYKASACKACILAYKACNIYILYRLRHIRRAIARARLCTRKKSTPCLIKKLQGVRQIARLKQ